MATLSTLTSGIENRLKTGFAALAAAQPETLAALTDVAVLVQDAADLENQIDIAAEKIGLLCLVNMPSFRNDDPLSLQINARHKVIVEVGEEPIFWRDEPLTKPKGADVAQYVSSLLQGFYIAGFQPLRVLNGDFQKDKKRQVYFIEVETMQVFTTISV